MANKFKYDVIQRWQGNPLLTIEDIPFPCSTVFNAACAKYKGQYILLLRVEDLTGRSVFALARSDDGYHFELEPEPVMTPCKRPGCFNEYEKKGIEDPRITEIDGIYYIKVYYGASDTSICLGTAKVNELMQFCTIGEH